MKNILRSVSYFTDLTDDELKDVENSAVIRSYQPEQMVLVEGDPAEGLYIVESGWLKVVKLSASGRAQVLNFLGSGESFNGVAVFTDALNQATVVALENSVVWCIRRATMQELLNTHPKLSQYVIRDLADRLQHLVGLVEDLSLRSIESRLSRMLLEGIIGNSIPREKWATQTEIASRLGTVPDVLNRALRKLEDEGIIEVTRHRIKILDSERLRQKIDP